MIDTIAEYAIERRWTVADIKVSLAIRQIYTKRTHDPPGWLELSVS